MRLSDSFPIRIDKFGARRSSNHSDLHQVGAMMMASPRNTARSARSANFSGAIGGEALRELLCRLDLAVRNPDLGTPVGQFVASAAPMPEAPPVMKATLPETQGAMGEG